MPFFMHNHSVLGFLGYVLVLLVTSQGKIILYFYYSNHHV